MTVVGYIDDGAIYCGDCVGESAAICDAVFDHNEFDYPLHCEGCREFLPASLTRHGYQWVHQQVADGWDDPERYEEYDAHFDFSREIRFCRWSFLGRYDALGNFEDF